MKRFLLVGTALAISAVAASGASAAGLKKFGSEAGWDIYVNEQMGPGCLLAQVGPNHEQIQIGIDATKDDRGYMALYTRNGTEMAAGETRAVKFAVGGETFEGQAVGQQLDGYDGAFVPVNNPEFIYDLAKKETLTITPAGGDPIVISLAGTDAAFKALRACQEAQ